jgi:hypothetical protein
MVKQFLVLGVLAVLASTASAERRGKPTAPVEVRLESRVVAGGYSVTLVAIPTIAVPRVEISLAGKSVVFAATAAGQRRELTVPVTVARGAGVDVVGSARVGTRNRAAVLRVGVARAEAPRFTVTRTLPDGRQVAEVRQ